MAATRTGVPGLSATEVQSIRDTLAAGRKPRVMFTEAAGQIAGQTGQVVELTDPTSSDEWLVVRFGRDELPFSPADLSIPRRGAPGPRTGHSAGPDVRSARLPEFKLGQPPAPAPQNKASAAGPPTRSVGSPAAPPRSAEAAPPGSAEAAPPRAAEAAPAAVDARPAAPVEARPTRRASRAARPKGPAGLTVTVAYAAGTWTVAATQGSKALAKPATIRPAEALKMVGLLAVPAVHEAVEQILAGERAEAESRAQQLRAELAQIEARLAELRETA